MYNTLTSVLFSGTSYKWIFGYGKLLNIPFRNAKQAETHIYLIYPVYRCIEWPYEWVRAQVVVQGKQLLLLHIRIAIVPDERCLRQHASADNVQLCSQMYCDILAGEDRNCGSAPSKMTLRAFGSQSCVQPQSTSHMQLVASGCR